jgi:hypothetical protein
MKKMTAIALALAIMVVAGAAVASAHFLGGNDGESPEEIEGGEIECSAGTCGGQCGGSCGIPSCGCGRK